MIPLLHGPEFFRIPARPSTTSCFESTVLCFVQSWVCSRIDSSEAKLARCSLSQVNVQRMSRLTSFLRSLAQPDLAFLRAALGIPDGPKP